MTTPAQGNLPGSSGKPPDPGFEASGLSPDEAERLAATFRPSWEFDEAPFVPANTPGHGGLDAAQIEALARPEPEAPAQANGDSRIVPAHAPPQRVETHEPEVSVIIDRSITSAEIDAQRMAATAPARPPTPAPVAAPSFAAAVPRASDPWKAPATAPAPQRIAPVMKGPRGADDSLELPASLKKSNKGLFIGLGVAVVAAGAVLVIHGAMSSPEATAPSPAATATTAVATATPNATEQRAASIPPPPPAAPTPTQATAIPAAVAPAPPTPAPPRNAAVTPPKPPPHVAAPVVHHAAPPRNPPKPAGGGIVRDVPF